MSMFIRKHVNGVSRSKYTKDSSIKRKRKAPVDDEITSSEDEDVVKKQADQEDSLSEEEHETAQEKKLRLAKVYLEEIERQEKERLEDKEIDKDAISQRLKEDYLKHIGKFRSKEADNIEKIDKDNIRHLKCREHNNTITCLCISSDDIYLFSGSKDGNIVKWSLIDNKKSGVIRFTKQHSGEVKGHSKRILCLTLSTDNKFLVVGDESPDIQVWDPTTLKHIKTLKSHRNAVTGVCFQRDTHNLYSCSKDRAVKVWSLDEMTYVETLYGHQDMITSIDALYRDRVITSGGSDATVRVWKITSESQLIYNGPPGNIDVVRLINEEHFVTGGDNGQLCIWSSLKKKPICTVKDAHGIDPTTGLPLWITSIASFVNTDVIASGSYNGSIKIWKLSADFKSINILLEIPVIGFVNSLAFTSDGSKLIASCGKDHRLGRWSVIKEAKNSIIVIPICKYKS